MSSKWFLGFVDGSNHHTCNLASVSWVIYEPTGPLVSSGTACLGPATKNVVEYNVFIELLRDVIVHGVTFLEVRLDSPLVVSQLNEDY